MHEIGSSIAVSVAAALLAAGCIRLHVADRHLPAASLSAPSPGSEDTALPPPVAPPAEDDPDATAVEQARLVGENCDSSQAQVRDLMDRRIEEMRAAVDEEFRIWRSLPACNSSWGVGGLALSGVGEGGGGRGEGIGLGDVGITGHATSTSGTNNQVATVDEADIVKNDGAYLYLASHGALRIVAALRPRLLSVTKVPGVVRQMLISGDRVVVFSATSDSPPERTCTYGYDCSFGGDGSGTIVAVIDVSDRSHPKTVRRIDFSGSLVAARRVAETVHVVVADGDTPDPEYSTSPSDLPECYRDVAAVEARFRRLTRDNEAKIRAARPTFPTVSERGIQRPLCDVLQTPLGDGSAFTTVASFGLRDDHRAPTLVTLQSRPGAVYAAEDNLYVAVDHRRSETERWYPFYQAQREVSDVHQFRIGATPEETRYVGSGVVPGHVLNQFSMDEWNGHLRIATTRGRIPDPDADSIVSVLATTREGNLVRVGAADHIAPREDIRAVRFDGDRGYVVTFKKTDPLFVLDLRYPTAPRIVGELKIPGFSTYLHRVDPTHLLSIGFDADDHGDYAYFDGLLLQLFDVTRPTEPALLFKEKIGTRGSSSEAATDHLAFNYFAERHLLAVPATVCEGGGDGTAGDRMTFSGLLVYELTLEHGFRRLGGVAHGKAGATCTSWWSGSTSAVKRSVVMDDLVFSIASDRVKVQRLGRLGEDVADIAVGP